MNKTDSDKRNQQKCEKCGKTVGVDYQGRKHKCSCDIENKRYWIDDNPIEKPFGKNTCGIVDEQAGGVTVYACQLELACNLLKLLEKQDSKR